MPRSADAAHNSNGPEVDAEIARIGDRLRRWREEADLTLQALAQRSGVATSTIQKIETAQMIPSVAVLLKVSRGLGRRPAELIHDGADELDAIVVRADERHAVGVSGKILVERLTGDLFEPALETWRVTLHPGHSSGEIHYDGEELALVEAGVVTFRVGDREYEVRAGDSFHFKAALPHSWRNEGRTPARFTITGTLPRLFRKVMQARVGTREAPEPT